MRLLFTKLFCWWNGHDWDKMHGFRGQPAFDATCYRCGLVTESYEEWEALRTKV
jgi:hypothetical protein